MLMQGWSPWWADLETPNEKQTARIFKMSQSRHAAMLRELSGCSRQGGGAHCLCAPRGCVARLVSPSIWYTFNMFEPNQDKQSESTRVWETNGDASAVVCPQNHYITTSMFVSAPRFFKALRVASPVPRRCFAMPVSIPLRWCWSLTAALHGVLACICSELEKCFQKIW